MQREKHYIQKSKDKNYSKLLLRNNISQKTAGQYLYSSERKNNVNPQLFTQ